MDLQYSNWKIRLKIDDFVFFTSILPNIWPFLELQEPLKPIYALQSAYLVLFCSWNHFFCPFMDLQCSKWHIGLKIEDFVFFTSILPKIWPFLQLPVLVQPIYALQSTFLVLFCLCNHFFCPFMDLQHSKWQTDLKIENFVFLTPLLAFILAYIVPIMSGKFHL